MIFSYIKKYIDSILIIFLLLITSFFRLYKLSTIPYGLNNDAAWEGSAAYDILRGNIAPYLPYAAEGWRGEGIIRLFVTVCTIFLGNNPLTIRLSTVIFGIAIIFPLYQLTKLLFTRNEAFIAAFLVAISGWHITMSKSGWRAVTVPFFSTLCFYYWFRAIASKRRTHFMWCGLFLAGSLYTYDAARIIPFFFLCIITTFIVTHRTTLQNYYKGIGVLLISFIIAVAPIAIYGLTNWSNFTHRGDFLFVGHEIIKTQSIAPLVENIRTAVLLFTQRANGNDFFIFEPLMDQPARWLFPIGICISIWLGVFKKNKKYVFMLLWFVVGIIPGILSVPNGNRSIGVIPPAYFFCAVGIMWMSALLKKLLPGKFGTIVVISSITILFVYGTIVTYNGYIGPQRRELIGFYPETYVTMPYVKPFLSTHDVYFTNNYPRELLTYFLYTDGDPFLKHYTWLERNEDFLSVKKQLMRGVLFVMWAIPENEHIADILLQKYPSAKKRYVYIINDQIYRQASILIDIPK